MIYLDTGCLLKLYFPEPESPRVAKLVAGQVLVFIALHDLELTNALELKRLRKEADARQTRETQELVASDIRTGVLYRPTLVWEDVWEEAKALARKYTRTLGCRSLDILHCAAALQLSAAAFITTDGRQRRLALAMGLHVPLV